MSRSTGGMRNNTLATGATGATGALWASFALLLQLLSATGFAADAAAPSQTIRLDETVISGNQELPKVLYILPWQAPDGLPEIEVKADMAEAELFRRLYPPAYRRELKYFETLDRIQSEE